MKRKRYYITIEVEANVDKDISKDEQRHSLIDYIRNGMSRTKKQSIYIQSGYILNCIDEKGNEL